jgi:hypothetical protein
MHALGIAHALVKRARVAIVTISKSGAARTIATCIAKSAWVTVITGRIVENELTAARVGITDIVGAFIAIIALRDATAYALT